MNIIRSTTGLILTGLMIGIFTGCGNDNDNDGVSSVPNPSSTPSPTMLPSPSPSLPPSPSPASDAQVQDVQMAKLGGGAMALMHLASMAVSLQPPENQKLALDGARWNCSGGGFVDVEKFESNRGIGAHYFFDQCIESIGIVNGLYTRGGGGAWEGDFTITDGDQKWNYSNFDIRDQYRTESLPGNGNFEHFSRGGNRTDGVVSLAGDAAFNAVKLRIGFIFQSSSPTVQMNNFDITMDQEGSSSVYVSIESNNLIFEYDEGIAPLKFRTLTVPTAGELQYLRSFDSTANNLRGHVTVVGRGLLNATFEGYNDFHGASDQFIFSEIINNASLMQNINRDYGS